jgi:hypothetical protein
LIIACIFLSLWISPAAAQDYGRILSEDQGRVTTVDLNDTALATRATGDLARTGSDQIVPMVEAAIVLLGGGSLLLLVARRRAAQRRRHNALGDRSGA